MPFAHEILERNKKIILSLLFELAIAEDYDFLMSEKVNSIFLSTEKDDEFETNVGFIGRSRLLIKYRDDDEKKKRKAIKNLSISNSSLDFEQLIIENTKMELLIQLIKQQKVIKELLKLEETIKNKNQELINKGVGHYNFIMDY